MIVIDIAIETVIDLVIAVNSSTIVTGTKVLSLPLTNIINVAIDIILDIVLDFVLDFVIDYRYIHTLDRSRGKVDHLVPNLLL